MIAGARGSSGEGTRGRGSVVRSGRLLAVLVVATLVAATLGGVAGSSAASFDDRAVWRGADVHACNRSDKQATWDCMQSAMARNGASAEAIDFARHLAADGEWGWMSTYRSLGTVGLATVTHPFRERGKQVTVLVGRRSLIDVDAYVLSDTDRTRHDFSAVVDHHPRANVWPGAVLEKNERLSNGGQRLVFRANLGDCHTCDPYGAVKIQYVFSNSGDLDSNGLVEVNAR